MRRSVPQQSFYGYFIFRIIYQAWNAILWRQLQVGNVKKSQIVEFLSIDQNMVCSIKLQGGLVAPTIEGAYSPNLESESYMRLLCGKEGFINWQA